MLFHFGSRIVSQTRNNPFYSILNPLLNERFTLPQTLTLKMVTRSTSKRPICPSCSKPTSLCLCTRMKTPILENSIAVTILQHSLEKKHPLNSTRIAKLGLKILNVVWVSDVNFEAQFNIRRIQTNCKVGSVDSEVKNDGFSGIENHRKFDDVNGSNSRSGSVRNSEFGRFLKHPEERKTSCNTINSHWEYRLRSDLSINPFLHPLGIDEPAITFTIEKYGFVRSLTHCSMPETESRKPNFDQLLASPEVSDAMEKGFIVKKLKKKQLNLNGGNEYEESKEFEITVPPGSVLLFPSEKSVGVEAIDFEVKNLIVLDGTWAKAKRMYNENPWLKLLQHLKLDVDKLSLYGEVRHQPRAEYLSTLESIVYALKAVGESPEGLDGLLDVFESMVGDQRRCKDERLSKATLV